MTRLNDFNMYQQNARKTALYPQVGSNLWYPALGLNGEAGEVAEKVKKIYRDNQGTYEHPKLPWDVMLADNRNDIARELGDVLWYVSNLASEFHISLQDIAEDNIKKLADRANRDKIHGSGDRR